MAVLKCKMCGGELVLEPDSTIAECEYCGSLQTVPAADSEKKMTLFNRANRLRFACEFDKAAGIYEAIVADFPEEAEAYWGLVLCKYGIEYVDDPATAKKIPTCHRSSFDSVMDDENFEQALENADAPARKVYRAEAKQIEEIRKGIIEVSTKEDPYDIFICYKETDENGDRTLDSLLAQDIYDALTEKGYRTYFARISLEDKLGQEYEPYIFAALNSARIMLAVGTDYEYYNAVWVKNEWSRFLHLIASGQKKTLIPCYKNIDAYDMPREFAKLQAQDLGKVGAIQDLLRGVDKIMPRETPVVQAVRAVQTTPASNFDSALAMGFMDIELGKLESAERTFRDILMQDSECPEAYLGMILVSDGTEQAAFQEKFLQFAPPKMSSLEKKVFTLKTQNVLLHTYLQLGNSSRFSESLEHYKGDISTDLCIEILLDHPSEALIRVLVAHGCDLNAVIHEDFSDGSHDCPLLNYLMNQNVTWETLEAMLKCGADPNGVRVWRRKDGRTSIYSALSDSIWRQKNLDYARVLIRHRADVNFMAKVLRQDNTYGEETMLHEAVLEGNLDMVKLLLENGADPNEERLFRVKNEDTWYSALHDCIWKHQDAAMAELLLQHGANIEYVAKIYFNDGTYSERTPLHQAVLKKSFNIAALLLEHGADARAKRLYRNQNSSETYSILSDAIWNIKDIAFVELLLKNGADPSDCTQKTFSDGHCEHESMLHCAVKYAESPEMVKLLVQYGASIQETTTHKGEAIPFKKFPYRCDGTMENTLYDLGWRRPWYMIF